MKVIFSSPGERVCSVQRRNAECEYKWTSGSHRISANDREQDAIATDPTKVLKIVN